MCDCLVTRLSAAECKTLASKSGMSPFSCPAVDIHAHDMVAGLRETRPADRADVARAENRHPHALVLAEKERIYRKRVKTVNDNRLKMAVRV